MICALFGHRNASYDIKDKLESTILSITEKEPATVFYVGTQGTFDQIVWETLCQIKESNSRIRCYKILAYLPTDRGDDEECTIYPEGLELIPPKLAIIKRNEWMINKADVVITYTRHSGGGAANAKAFAKRKGKKVIDI